MGFRNTSLASSLTFWAFFGLGALLISGNARAVPILGLLTPAEDQVEIFLDPPTEVSGASLASGFPIVAGSIDFETGGGLGITGFTASSNILGCSEQMATNDGSSASLSFTCFTSPITARTLVATVDISGQGSLGVHAGSVLFLDGVGLIVQGEAVPTVELSGELVRNDMGDPEPRDPMVPEPTAAVLFAVGVLAVRRVLAY